MTATDSPFHPGDVDEGPLPQRTPGATLPYTPIPHLRRPSSQAGLATLRFSHPAPSSDVPSLVELDRRDEVRSLLAGAIWISTGGVGNLYDFGHTYAVDPFLAADAILARFDVRAVIS